MTENKDTSKVQSSEIVSTVPNDAIKVQSSDNFQTVPSATIKIESNITDMTKAQAVDKTVSKESGKLSETGNSDFSKEFSGLPIEHLICDPIIAVAHGQEKLCDVYLNTLFKLAYEGKEEDDGAWTPDQTKPVRQISFLLNRPFVDEQGTYNTATVQVNAPLLSLVPIPAFTMDEITVDFTMEIKDHKIDTSHKDVSSNISLKGSRFGIGATISGQVTTGSNSTRGTDRSAKYDIKARAIQQPPAEGMAKLTSLFASVIEPLPTSQQQ